MIPTFRQVRKEGAKNADRARWTRVRMIRQAAANALCALSAHVPPQERLQPENFHTQHPGVF